MTVGLEILDAATHVGLGAITLAATSWATIGNVQAIMVVAGLFMGLMIYAVRLGWRAGSGHG